METVYIVGIVAAAIVAIVIVILLRQRITSAKSSLDLKERKISGEFKAESPEKMAELEHKKLSAPTPSGIRENVQIGNPIIRILKGTRVFRNWQIGSGKIEVMDPSDNDKKRPAN